LSKKWYRKGEDQQRGSDDKKPTRHDDIKWPSSYSVRIERSPEDEKRYVEQNKQGTRQLRTAKTLNWITGCAAFVGLFGLFYLHSQLGAMLESNKINRDSLTSVQRAFITYASIHEVRSQDQTGRHFWTMRTTIENSGATPAVSVINLARMDALPGEPDDQVFKSNVPQIPSISIGPRASVFASSVNEYESSIFGNDLPIVLSAPPTPKPNLYLWGWIAYRDIFPGTKTHVTEYCLHLAGIGINSQHDALIWSWDHCQTHNCTDEYCYDYANIAAKISAGGKSQN
jgi:hypothetical protein